MHGMWFFVSSNSIYIMYKKIIVSFIFLCAPLVGLAQVDITEVMYDLEGSDGGHEWIEIFNSGSEQIAITEWKFFEANTNHRISAVEGGIETITPGEYAVIADNIDKFNADNPTYTGLLFDSAFSLSNTGETIIIRDPDLVDSDVFTYTSDIGAKGDGQSLHKVNGVVSARVVSLGSGVASETVIGTTTGVISEVNAAVLSSHSSSAPLTKVVAKKIFSASAGRHRLASENAPVQFDADYKKGKSNMSPRFVWSFGDGETLIGERVVHAYQFAGVYTVVLNAYQGNDHSVSRTKITIVEPKVNITSATREYVEITNSSKHELNLNDWMLKTKNTTFKFPTDTILEPEVPVKFPNKITGILYNFGKKIALHNPLNHALALYSVPTVKEINEVLGTTTPNNPEDTVSRVTELLQKLSVLEGALNELRRIYIGSQE
ncbi:hypothetical protein COB55_02830 [Candidatus Wolfebacteria bacterium]|nr:MAG: hypothetical protein COB55_02830 [Candidatus Wolfebacteria bacterium]